MIHKGIKRGFDLSVSFLALVILSPLFLVIALGIKLSSKGPVFYTSMRIGMNGKPFTIYKFRSMHVRQRNEKESKILVNQQRIFLFGSFLRKSKLDELPQLINVFLGHMSVVGPRPYPETYIQKNYVNKYREILSVRPGLACLDSLYDYAHGDLFVTDETEYVEKVIPVKTELAWTYVQKSGFTLDLYCIGRTIILIFEIIVLRKQQFIYTAYEKKARNSIFGTNCRMGKEGEG